MFDGTISMRSVVMWLCTDSRDELQASVRMNRITPVGFDPVQGQNFSVPFGSKQVSVILHSRMSLHVVPVVHNRSSLFGTMKSTFVLRFLDCSAGIIQPPLSLVFTQNVAVVFR